MTHVETRKEAPRVNQDFRFKVPEGVHVHARGEEAVDGCRVKLA